MASYIAKDNLMIFGPEYNESLDNELISKYSKIIFNQHVDNLPPSITHLTFGRYFNQKVDNLPSSGLTHLTFGINFNQKVDDLPSLIKEIQFYRYSNYNNELNCLPNSVELIILPEKYNKQIKKIPKNIKKIIN